MAYNNRGISNIISTLIFVLLTIVLIGIVWVLVNNIVSNSSKQAANSAQCLNTQIQVTAAQCNYGGTSCNITVQRSTGSDTVNGIQVVVSNSSGQSAAGTIPTDNNTFQTLQSVVGYFNLTATPVVNVTTVQAVIYFASANGQKQICPSADAVTFTDVGLGP